MQEKIEVSTKVVSVSLTPTPVKSVKLLLTGDIMLGRTVNSRSLDMGDTKYPFEKVADKLREADVVFANLESPIVHGCPRIESGFSFCADIKMTEGLTFSGIDIVTLANNHNLNFGKNGLNDTEEILTEKGIKQVGLGSFEIIEKEGIKFGFLGFDFVSDTLIPADLELIRDADNKVDFLIVGVHWGNEYKALANNWQKTWAKEIVKAGADIVVGHHPHWVQDMECFENVKKTRGADTDPLQEWTRFAPLESGCPLGSKSVYYSLGNFVFDQMWSEETKKGLAIELTFENGKLVKEERLPVYMKNWAQPEWVESNEM